MGKKKPQKTSKAKPKMPEPIGDDPNVPHQPELMPASEPEEEIQPPAGPVAQQLAE